MHGGKGCTTRHTGTSAAAPIAAGMVALMLQVRPCLTWRDVQYLIAMTAQKVFYQIMYIKHEFIFVPPMTYHGGGNYVSLLRWQQCQH